MHAGISPQWAEMHLSAQDNVASESLHGLSSEQLHLHIYAVHPEAAQSVFRRSPQVNSEPCQNSESGNDLEAASKFRSQSDNKHQSSKVPSSESTSNQHLLAVDKKSFPNGTTDPKWKRSDIQLTADATQAEAKVPPEAKMIVGESKSHPAECKAEAKSCKLILAADIALNELDRLSDILGTFRHPQL